MRPYGEKVGSKNWARLASRARRWPRRSHTRGYCWRKEDQRINARAERQRVRADVLVQLDEYLSEVETVAEEIFYAYEPYDFESLEDDLRWSDDRGDGHFRLDSCLGCSLCSDEYYRRDYEHWEDWEDDGWDRYDYSLEETLQKDEYGEFHLSIKEQWLRGLSLPRNVEDMEYESYFDSWYDEPVDEDRLWDWALEHHSLPFLIPEEKLKRERRFLREKRGVKKNIQLKAVVEE